MFPTCDSLWEDLFQPFNTRAGGFFFYFLFFIFSYSFLLPLLGGYKRLKIIPLHILPFMVEDGLVSVIVLFDWELQVIKFSGILSVRVNMEPKTLH